MPTNIFVTAHFLLVSPHDPSNSGQELIFIFYQRQTHASAFPVRLHHQRICDPGLGGESLQFVQRVKLRLIKEPLRRMYSQAFCIEHGYMLVQSEDHGKGVTPCIGKMKDLAKRRHDPLPISGQKALAKIHDDINIF